MSAVSPAITKPQDLPAGWYEKFCRCSAAYYRQFRGKKSPRWIEAAAFEDVRGAYLKAMAALMLKQQNAAAD